MTKKWRLALAYVVFSYMLYLCKRVSSNLCPLTIKDESDTQHCPYQPPRIAKLAPLQATSGSPLKELFLLDLSLSPPPPSPGIASDADHKNLTLHTTSGFNAEIWISHDRSTKLKRASLELCSGNGMVRAIEVRLSRF